jgi:phospholipase/lecithinase/hemolysin
LIPRLNGSPTTSVPATEATEIYNKVLRAGIKLVGEFNVGKHLELSQLNVFALFDKIVAAPSDYWLVNVTDSSQGIPVDPDTYLFWDGLHPTTHGHNILATTAAGVIAEDALSEDSAKSDRGLSDPHANTPGEFVPDLVGAAH